ncbi:GIY-YIG nuclease family protein [Pseudolysinimonas sp.]|uniref:GIY-YIG nuclease family protein n=1 Tax=Pseudolysinimonas sp. TaxID=2680009 RepID=UPI003267CF58
MPHVYLLKCADGTYYVGSTWDLERRLWQHSMDSETAYTAKRLPVELVFAQEYDRVDEAWERERQIHGWSRRKKEALIAQHYDELPALSRGTHLRTRGFDTSPSATAQPADE